MIISDDFGINGRFLTQSMTGVQRYALNVTRAVGEICVKQNIAIPVLVPPDTKECALHGLELKALGSLEGHAWEQLDLPRKFKGGLLNLCNTAPAFKRNQVVCIHDANVFLAPESYSTAFRAFYKILQPSLARRAANITTVSKFSAKQISAALSINETMISVLPNGHEHVFYWDAKQSDKARSILSYDGSLMSRPFVLALGSQAKHKNLKLALDLSCELKNLNINLIIAGGHAKVFKNEKVTLSDNIHYIGFVSDHDLAYLFERALCLVFPSLTEGFGLPVLEAMALGCPVISTDRASLPELCGNAALLASPTQPLEWVSHLRSLVSSNNLRHELVGRGRAQAAKFSWSRTAEGYIDIVNRII